jgi:hypothetical protein
MSREAPSNRAPRLSVRLAAELVLGGVRTSGSTRDVSVGGACVEIDRLLEDGTELDVTLIVVEDDIESADSRTLTLRGRVQWGTEADNGGFAHGLKFIDEDANKLNMLRRALTALGLSS